MKIKKEFEKNILLPIFDNAKSFYNKAYTIECIQKFLNPENKTLKYTIYKIELYSYNTLVLTLYYNYIDGIDDDYFYKYTLNDTINKDELFSKTTLRHIKEFLKQKEIFTSYNITKKDIIENNNKIYTHKNKKL